MVRQKKRQTVSDQARALETSRHRTHQEQSLAARVSAHEVRGVIAIEANQLLSQLTALLIIEMKRAKRLPKAAPHCCAATQRSGHLRTQACSVELSTSTLARWMSMLNTNDFRATNQYLFSIIPVTCRLRLAKALNAGCPIITRDTNRLIHCLQGCAPSLRDAPLRFAPSNFLTMPSYPYRSDEDAITSRGEADSLQLDPKFRPHSPRNPRRQTSPRWLSAPASSTPERAHARTHRVSVLIVLS
jgi:hypothetical protein